MARDRFEKVERDQTLKNLVYSEAGKVTQLRTLKRHCRNLGENLGELDVPEAKS